jgi:hypothetical protein
MRASPFLFAGRLMAQRGYLVTFDLRKSANREPREAWVTKGDLRLFDVVL